MDGTRVGRNLNKEITWDVKDATIVVWYDAHLARPWNAIVTPMFSEYDSLLI
jgi:hypothetical protein